MGKDNGPVWKLGPAVTIKLTHHRAPGVSMGMAARTVRFRRFCWYCGVGLVRNWDSPARATKDHVQPLSRGGTDDSHNIVDCCKACNTDKRAFTLEQFRARRGGGPFWGERATEAE